MEISTFDINSDIAPDKAGILRQIVEITDKHPGLVYRPVGELSGGRAVVAHNPDGKLAGFLLIMPFNRKFRELGSLYVQSQYRGRGVAKKLITKAINSPNQNQGLISRTNIPQLRDFLVESGFKPIPIKSNSRLLLRFFLSRGTHWKKLIKFAKTIHRDSCTLIYGP